MQTVNENTIWVISEHSQSCDHTFCFYSTNSEINGSPLCVMVTTWRLLRRIQFKQLLQQQHSFYVSTLMSSSRRFILSTEALCFSFTFSNSAIKPTKQNKSSDLTQVSRKCAKLESLRRQKNRVPVSQVKPPRRVKPNAGETELQIKTSNKDTAGNLLTAGDQHGPNTAAQSSVYRRAALKTFNHEKKQELNTNKRRSST